MHMVPIDRSNMNHHLVTSRDLTDQLAHEDQRPLPTLDIDISLPTRYDTYSPRSYGCQISPSASHRMLRIPSPKGEGFTDPQNATLNIHANPAPVSPQLPFSQISKHNFLQRNPRADCLGRKAIWQRAPRRISKSQQGSFAEAHGNGPIAKP